ncbi:MAG: hypothetical protein WDK96_03495 [Candidatus Paceibacterota bacterium]|jgi:hypothetical protein
MKNIIKKITFILIATALVFSGASQSFASASLVTQTKVCNYTDNPGSDSCWVSSVSADEGETISVTVMYRNGGDSNANSLRIKLNNQNFSASNSHTIISTTSALNVSGTTSNSATVNLSSSQTLQFIPGTLTWRKLINGTLQDQTLPSGQSETSVFGGGLNIGTVAPGWDNQGSIVLRFKVGTTPIDPIEIGNPSITTNTATNISGSSATLRGTVNPNGGATKTWFEYGTTTALGNSTSKISRGSGTSSVSFNEAISVLPSKTYYFRAFAENNAGTEFMGSMLTFLTPSLSGPTIVTNTATNITLSGATLNGSVNPNGSPTTSYFQYGTNSNLTTYSTTSVVNQGSGTSAIAMTSNLSSLQLNTTYYFRAVAKDSTGTEYFGSILSFNTGGNNNPNQAPTVTTNSATSITESNATLNGYVDGNGTSTTTWFQYGTNQGLLNNSTNIVSIGINGYNMGEFITGLQPNTIYYFRAVAQNSYGTSYGSVLSFTTNSNYVPPVPPIPPNPNVAPIALTTTANAIGKISARLNGLVLISGNLSTNAWFEYGTTTALGNTTQVQTIGSSGSIAYSQAIYNLNPNTNYYFRAVAQNGAGTSQGNILNFKTLANSSTVVVYTGNGTGVSSKIFLQIENHYKNIAVGDSIEYTVSYKNISGKLLKKAVLRITLPEEVEFTKTSAGEFSQSDNTLTVDIGDLVKNQEGKVYLQGKVLPKAKNSEMLVTSAILVFTNTNGAQEDATAYVLNDVEGGNSNNLTAASIFGDGSFLPNTLIGWILLILAIFILVLIGRRIYDNQQNKKIMVAQTK